MNGIYILAGSNLGDRLSNLRKSQTLLEKHVRILNESSIYETEPWGNKDQEWFLNVILQVETKLSPKELLELCLKAEEEMGRIRQEKWGARIIDLDILYFNDEIVDEEHLSIPHQGIPDRRFTLIPLVELCPNQVHPILNHTQVELLASCTDTLDCRLTEFRL